MSDEVVMGLLKDRDLRVVAVNATEVARKARSLHHMEFAAASVFAQATVAASLMTALQLQKSDARVNFQLECDGALRGLFIETNADGHVRGYVKNPFVSTRGNENEWEWRPVFGNQGYISVLRDQGNGEFFRSSVELSSFDLALDFEKFFVASEQLEAAVFLEVIPRDGEALGSVLGLLIQPLPSGDREALAELRRSLRGEDGLRKIIDDAGDGASAAGLLSRVFDGGDLELTSRYPLEWNCPCSRDRVVRALVTLGSRELEELLAERGKAEADCHFCNAHYEVPGEELRKLIDGMKTAG
ncbi:MAG: Hsp33 family molecular chaperone HslO [Myxococcaceae bacterium]